jgi:hypothetical protein
MARDFHCFGRDLDWVMDEMPLSKAFAFAAFATESQPWVSMRNVSDGYMAQEAASLRRQLQ